MLSVILPVYNAEKYISNCIESILNQDYVDFEFIIINDGSTDSTLSIIKKYADLDKRIIFYNRKNHGLVYTLNELISRCSGNWIFRADADDIYCKNRLSIQLQYSLKYNLDVCGTWAKSFGLFSKNIIVEPEPSKIPTQLLFTSCLVHPSVMYKKEIFNIIQYRDIYTHAEDYDLWTRCVMNGFRIGNIPLFLMKYRVHDMQVSNIYKSLQHSNFKKIQYQYWIFYFNFHDLSKNNFEFIFDNINSFKSISFFFGLFLRTNNRFCFLKNLIKIYIKNNLLLQRLFS